MKCVVMGYHNIGCVGIEALLDNGFEISAIFTHKDNPKENIWFDSVAELASSKGIPKPSNIEGKTNIVGVFHVIDLIEND